MHCRRFALRKSPHGKRSTDDPPVAIAVRRAVLKALEVHPPGSCWEDGENARPVHSYRTRPRAGAMARFPSQLEGVRERHGRS